MRLFVCIALIVLAGCAQLAPKANESAVAPPAEGESGPRPQSRPDSVGATATVPSANARTAEEFDTTTAQERAEAAAAPVRSGARSLGTTIASLGDPAQPGFWIETPLVSRESEGRVDYNGQSAQLTLRPIDGPETAGSRLSLAAMRLLGAPLTGLPEVEVFVN